MAYEKLGFVDKETPLDAAHFNHMEGGIETANSVLETTTTNEITWDGVVGDRLVVDAGAEDSIFVHVSDYVPDVASLVPQDIACRVVTPDEEFSYNIASADEGDGLHVLTQDVTGVMAVIIVERDNAALMDFDVTVVFPKVGVYFLNAGNGAIYAESISSPLLSIPTTKIKKEALPDALQFGESETVEIIPETEVIGVEDMGAFVANIDPVFYGDDQTLVITFDGIEYPCVVNEMNGFFLYGNAGMMGIGANTGEPFLFFVNPGALAQLLMADGNTHRVSFGKLTVKTIDSEYLPVIPAEKLPGAIYLYPDAEKYLHTDEDTSDTSNRITRAQIREILRYNQVIYIRDGLNYFPPSRINVGSDTSWGVITVIRAVESLDDYQPVNYFSAEYSG